MGKDYSILLENAIGVDDNELRLLKQKISQKYIYGELTLQDFDNLKKQVLFKIDRVKLSYQNEVIDSMIFLHKNNFNYVRKWYEMERMMKAVPALVDKKQLLNQALIKNLDDIEFEVSGRTL